MWEIAKHQLTDDTMILVAPALISLQIINYIAQLFIFFNGPIAQL